MEIVEYFAVTIVAIALVIIVLNIVAALAFTFFPRLLTSPQEMMRYRYLDRFEGDLKPHLDDWFGLKAGDWEAFSAEYRRNEINVYAYEAYCEYRHPEKNGQFINISPHGFRHGENQGAWPPAADAFNIFFFGGSTTLNVGPDWTCISSYVQKFLDGREFDKPVRVYNFGRGAYFSTLEKSLFLKLLSEGHVPDLAIFLDGMNDSFFHHGLPATGGVYSAAIEAMNLELSAESRNRARARPKWNLLDQFMRSLPLTKAMTLLQKKAEGLPTQSLPPLTDDEINQILDRWSRNRRQIEAVCQAHGFPIAFVWQPHPAYKYDLKYHVALPHHFSMHGHERAEQVYDALRATLGDSPDGPNFLWLADIQETMHEPLYLDSVHYTDPFSKVIGGLIADWLVERDFVGKSS